MNELENICGRNAPLVVLEYLMRTRDTTTCTSGIAEEAGRSHSSVARVVAPLLELNIVKKGKMGKQIRTFTLNEVNEVTGLLIRFYEDLSNVLRD